MMARREGRRGRQGGMTIAADVSGGVNDLITSGVISAGRGKLPSNLWNNFGWRGNLLGNIFGNFKYVS